MNTDRSIFFPLALIAAGCMWILVSTGRVPASNLWALAHFWPFLLIAAGVGLILRGFWPPARMVMDVVIVGAAVASIFYAPQIGWASPQWFAWNGGSFGGGVSGSGHVVTETREIRGVSAVSISLPAEVVIRQGQTESLSIEAEDNLMPQLASDVENGTLVLRNKETAWNKRVNPGKPVRITLTVKDLRKLDFSGADSVRVEGLKTSELQVSMSGAGDLTLDQLIVERLVCRLSGAGSASANGTAADLQLVISGMGSFDGRHLTGKSADARISGAGSATVHPAESLSAAISGTGSISYFGSPSVSKQMSGLGSVRRLDE